MSLNKPYKKFIESFSDEEILLVSDKPFHYTSGGIGPYYIDLRRGPNNPHMFKIFLDKYIDKITGPTDSILFVGVPTTGVVYATGLALRFNSPLAIIEKLNPERVHIYSPETICNEINEISNGLTDINDSAFLGLEDMGVMLATGLGVKHHRPCAIMRRVQKSHGTSKTIEANLKNLLNFGVKKLYIINDPFNPQPVEDIKLTLDSIHGTEKFDTFIINRPNPQEMNIDNIKNKRVIEIEDLWTTGTSAINLHRNIKKVLDVDAEVLVFLDREQNAMDKFKKLNIDAKNAYGITEIANYLFNSKLIDRSVYSKVVDYVAQFKRETFTEKLVKVNSSSVCVGLDITPGKFPDRPEDTTLPNYPYEQSVKGVRQYCLDVLNEIAKVPEIAVIKPNLAYYNSLEEKDMHSIVWTILQRARELGLLVILDTKIGDIMRTQSQYAEKYKHFDAVTVHGFMGSDSIFPVTDAQLGCFVLVFTSNPSRVDVETKPILSRDSFTKYNKLIETGLSPEKAQEQVMRESEKVYHIMARQVIDWQYAGSIGAVIGGTPNSDGKLQELEEIVGIFADELNHLPPLLIPGVGTQGGTASDIIYSIVDTLIKRGWSEKKVRNELKKVLINSSSAIDYSPRPGDAARDLADEIRTTVDKYFA